MTGDAIPVGKAQRPRRPRRRALVLGLGFGLAFAALLLLAGTALAAFRYLPALDEARALRTDLESMVGRVEGAGMGIDRATMDALDADLASAEERLGHLRHLLDSDPLIGVARALPPTAANVRGADGVAAAARDLLDAVGQGLAVGHRFVEIREAQAADPRTASALSQLVELMATTRDRAVAAAASVDSARRTAAAVPDGLIGPVESVRNAMLTRIDKYDPLLETYLTVSARLPAILGWDGPRRYLVLTQDPAELRPTGGFIGSYGIIAFDRGRLTEHRFQDTDPLDFPWDYPVIRPPQELADYLLGPKQPWQFADGNWSPDFPTSARDALRLYTNESGDADIDGVFGVTTYTIDQLLTVIGPVAVPDYNVTIASGETTLKGLQLTRAAPVPGQSRKAFLSAFADRLFASIVALPPGAWADLVGATEVLGWRHLLLAWFPDAADEELVTMSGFDGAVRQDPGDYLYPVDANVAPASKLNLVTTRTLQVDVQIDAVGNARNTIKVTWQNKVNAPEWAVYRAMVSREERTLGMYFRLLVPVRSRIDGVSVGGLAAVVDDEVGRMAIGKYLRIPPGTTTLRYTWTSPYAADVDATGGAYRLTIQAQPGMAAGPLIVTIRVPDGFRVTAASPKLRVSGALAALTTTLDRDIVVGLLYGR